MKAKKRTPPTAKGLPPEAFDENPRVALVLTEEAIYLTRFDDRGTPLVTYPVYALDVAGAFRGLGADTGLLPEHTLFWQHRSGRDRIGIWLPPAVRALTFPQGRRDVTLHIPLPGMVFVGEGHQYWIWAALERPSKRTDRLYAAPLPNVHTDGGICAGNVKFPVAAADTICEAARLFFESGFNHDLSNDRVRAQGDDLAETEEDLDPFQVAHEGPPRASRARKPISLFQFLKSLDGARVFPVDALLPSFTMGQLLSDERR